MAYIDDLVARVADPALRALLVKEVGQLRSAARFGLNFERHVPEVRATPGLRPVPGSKVRNLRTNAESVVVRVDGDQAVVADGTWPLDQVIRLQNLNEPIFPGLQAVESVGESELPSHILFEGENHHALEILHLLYQERFDCIYIDPPYNTGAKDWKYNNDYVDKKDAWRHSKWLSFMERRLKIAKRLLAPDGVLIVTIDENEHAHLVMLLEQLFPERTYPKRHIDSIAIVHNPRGIQGDNLSYVNEIAVIVTPPGKKALAARRFTPVELEGQDLQWLRKWGNESTRDTAANCFYPILVSGTSVVGFGEVAPDDFHPPTTNVPPEGNVTEVWPIDEQGVERKWRYARESIEEVIDRLIVTPRRDGAIDVKLSREAEPYRTVWTSPRFDSSNSGARLLSKFIEGDFPYPKSLYAVKECLIAATAHKPNALILDFFAGSGTTLHATMLLNAEDGGHRRCIVVTNNELEDEKQKALVDQGTLPGTPEYEAHGIARGVTWPRLKAAVTGVRANGEAIEGTYIAYEKPGCEACQPTNRYVAGRAIADGLPGRIDYYRITYNDPDEIELGEAFQAIHPLLWLRTGVGDRPRVESEQAFHVDPYHAILFQEAGAADFRDEVARVKPRVTWIVTDSEEAFVDLADFVKAPNEVRMLYRDYLLNFRFKVDSA